MRFFPNAIKNILMLRSRREAASRSTHGGYAVSNRHYSPWDRNDEKGYRAQASKSGCFEGWAAANGASAMHSAWIRRIVG
jgi:hypothetical protein